VSNNSDKFFCHHSPINTKYWELICKVKTRYYKILWHIVNLFLVFNKDGILEFPEVTVQDYGKLLKYSIISTYIYVSTTNF